MWLTLTSIRAYGIEAMKDERHETDAELNKTEPALTPLGTSPESPIRSREGDIIHTSPELAVGEGDGGPAGAGGEGEQA